MLSPKMSVEKKRKKRKGIKKKLISKDIVCLLRSKMFPTVLSFKFKWSADPI